MGRWCCTQNCMILQSGITRQKRDAKKRRQRRDAKNEMLKTTLQKRNSENETPETRRQKRDAKNKTPKTRCEKWDAENETPKTKRRKKWRKQNEEDKTTRQLRRADKKGLAKTSCSSQNLTLVGTYSRYGQSDDTQITHHIDGGFTQHVLLFITRIWDTAYHTEETNLFKML